MVENEIVTQAFKLVDPHHGTSFEKSRTAFLSFAPNNFQITISNFLGRQLGFLSGDRMAFIQHKTNPLVWLFFKSTQRFRTIEVKIRNGGFSANSKEYVDEIGKSFEFNQEYTGRIRLYVNMDNPIKHKISDGMGGFSDAVMYQLFDIAEYRKDIKPEHLATYVAKLKESNYIIKKQS